MTVSVSDKLAVIERDGGFCVLALANCMGEAQTADHRANRGQGGAGSRLDHGANLIGACALCNDAKERATGIVLLDLIERGLRILPASTHEKTLARVLLAPYQSVEGEWWMPESVTVRRPASRAEVAYHLQAVAA